MTADQPEGRAMTMAEINAERRTRRCSKACSEQHTYELPCQARAPQPEPDCSDALLDVIDRAVSTAGYWLPKPGRTAIAKAVTSELEASQRRTVVLVERIDAARAWARQHLPTDLERELLKVLAGRDDEPHVCKPGASLYYCPTSGRTESDCHGGFDTCCDQPDLHQLACGHCGGTGLDPEDPGDWIPEAGRHHPGTAGPCPECIQKGLPPRLDVSAPAGPSVLERILADADHHEKCAALSKTDEGGISHSSIAAGLRIAAEHVRHGLPKDGPGDGTVSLRKADVDLATAESSRDRWRRDYAELADRHKRVLAELDDTRDRIRQLHRPAHYGGKVICAECSAYDGHSSTDNMPVDHPCPTITALEPPKETP